MSSHENWLKKALRLFLRVSMGNGPFQLEGYAISGRLRGLQRCFEVVKTEKEDHSQRVTIYLYCRPQRRNHRRAKFMCVEV